jgi:hypothetical protein
MLLGPTAPSTGVHDELHAGALYLDDGERSVAILSLDLIGQSLAFSDELRQIIRRQTGVGTVLLNCSHTHSAPFSMPWSVSGWGQHCRDEADWRDSLRTILPDIVHEARSNAAPASLRAGRAAVQVGVNRRLPTADGVLMVPNPDGRVVTWVDVLHVSGVGGKPLAALFCHAAHPVIVHGASSLVGADYPGAAVARIRAALGDGVLPLFVQGCGADINGEPRRGGHSAAESAGAALGDAVLEAIDTSVPLDTPRLRTATRTVHLPCRPLPSAAECALAIDEVQAMLSDESETSGVSGKPTDEWADGWILADRLDCLLDLKRMVVEGQQPTVRFEMTVIGLMRGWCMLAMTHELTSAYALWADSISPFEHSMVAAYTNGCESYIPTDDELALGGYEAASFPDAGAALAYRYRLALEHGAEGIIKQNVGELLNGIVGGMST